MTAMMSPAIAATNAPEQALPRPPALSAAPAVQLDVQGVTRIFPGARGKPPTQALRPINLQVRENDFITILGPSGCGKSTLLRCINGLEEHQGGSIEMEGAGVFGKDISWQTARQKVGMVFQSYELFAHMTVIDNILLGPLKVQKRNRAEAEAQADKLLARVGLLERKNAYPRELSGGQKQRIAIVRALCLNPEVILLDEITAALDPEMVREVLEVVLELAREGMSMLIVTHEMGFARKVADRIVFMDKGAIVEQASPEVFFTEPKTERARQFLAGMDYGPDLNVSI